MVHEDDRASTPPADALSEAATLGKAVVRAAEYLSLSQQSLATILGVSRPTVTRLVHGRYALSRHRAHEWEMAVLFVRLFRSLDALLGHGETARTWLGGANTDLGAKPIELLLSAEGLVRVLHYLDAYRGQI
jgi:predicted XRE-type DNA-binding protein